MLTVDARCTHYRCEPGDIYRMVGTCMNCGAKPVLILYAVGHEAGDVECPVCRNRRSVKPSRLATEDEIPEAT